ncbi:unnamed protein product, partial [marine sediment metagenome]
MTLTRQFFVMRPTKSALFSAVLLLSGTQAIA